MRRPGGTLTAFVMLALSTCALRADAQAPLVFKSEVRMVEVYASIYDPKGRPVEGLKQDAFIVTDNGVPQPILTFETSDSSLQCAILLDLTGSMAVTLPSLKRAVVSLLNDLRPQDWVAVYGFRTSLDLVQDFTQDKEAARDAVMHVRAGGHTALFDAITQVAIDLSRRNGRKALIALTDGQDNASFLSPDAAAGRVRKVGVPLYTVAQGEALKSGELISQLEHLAALTGGLSFTAKKAEDVDEVFGSIYKDLSHSYMLGYAAPPSEESRWRTVQVTVKGADKLTIRAKQGYVP